MLVGALLLLLTVTNGTTKKTFGVFFFSCGAR